MSNSTSYLSTIDLTIDYLNESFLCFVFLLKSNQISTLENVKFESHFRKLGATSRGTIFVKVELCQTTIYNLNNDYNFSVHNCVPHHSKNYQKFCSGTIFAVQFPSARHFVFACNLLICKQTDNSDAKNSRDNLSMLCNVIFLLRSK
jgi:hypothetical protein